MKKSVINFEHHLYFHSFYSLSQRVSFDCKILLGVNGCVFTSQNEIYASDLILEVKHEKTTHNNKKKQQKQFS